MTGSKGFSLWDVGEDDSLYYRLIYFRNRTVG